MSHSVLSPYCLIAGGAVFGILGFLHALYTFLDIERPRRLVPDDPNVRAAMSATGVRLARGGTTMWRAWVGFNFSHSLGAVLFAVLCIGLGAMLPTVAVPKVVLVGPVAVGLAYLWLAIRYWFSIPRTGIAIGTALFAVAWLVY